MMWLNDAAAALEGHASAAVKFTSVESDTRSLRAGALFVALRGERFDGHGFVEQAAGAGAVAALVDRRWAAQAETSVPLLVVEDTRAALGTLAAFWRKRFDIPLIGVTGSNGKTTVKNMCASILRAQYCTAADSTDEGVLATPGNMNNDIGLPLTLLMLRKTHRAAVVEMGMNHPGELAYLSGIASPSVALVTNAQRAHLQGMKSVAEIAHEKGQIYNGLLPEGSAIINMDDAHAPSWLELNRQRRVVSFSLDRDADVSGSCELHGLVTTLSLHAPQGEAVVNLQVPGVHNARNALAAAAACLSAGVELAAVVRGLNAYAGTQGRLSLLSGVRGATVLDDSYNANPDSVKAGIDVLAATPGRKILVLGDMGEIGTASAQMHDEIGGYAKSQGIDALYALGDMSMVAVRNFGDGGQHFRSSEALADALKKNMNADTVVLVKGSRFMRMERIVKTLTANDDRRVTMAMEG